ncbi:MAG: hypothetical protein WD278_10275 [Pirellulales bacterium]
MSDITVLRINGTGIDDRALRHLAALPRLQVLMLSQTAVTDRGLQDLMKCRALRLVNLYETGVTTEGARQLQVQWPTLKVGTPQDGLAWGTEPEEIEALNLQR